MKPKRILTDTEMIEFTNECYKIFNSTYEDNPEWVNIHGWKDVRGVKVRLSIGSYSTNIQSRRITSFSAMFVVMVEDENTIQAIHVEWGSPYAYGGVIEDEEIRLFCTGKPAKQRR